MEPSKDGAVRNLARLLRYKAKHEKTKCLYLWRSQVETANTFASARQAVDILKSQTALKQAASRLARRVEVVRQKQASRCFGLWHLKARLAG